VSRIFSTLAIFGAILLAAAYWFGLDVGDASKPESAVPFTKHFFTALGAVIFSTLVHSVVLTYFMGTGRWLEETCNAYKLGPDWAKANQKLKWRVLPWLGLCVLMLILTGAFGAAADPASGSKFQGWFGLNAAGLHQVVALLTILLNFSVNIGEFFALEANGELINRVMDEVRRMRTERGLPN